MKISRERLKEIVKEEISSVLQEVERTKKQTFYKEPGIPGYHTKDALSRYGKKAADPYGPQSEEQKEKMRMYCKSEGRSIRIARDGKIVCGAKLRESDALEEMIGGEEEPTMGDIKYAEKRAYDMEDEAHDGLADLVSRIQKEYDVSTDKALDAVATILRAMEKQAER
jgi:hypothetical protein